jgi:hypothetical protein
MCGDVPLDNIHKTRREETGREKREERREGRREKGEG